MELRPLDQVADDVWSPVAEANDERLDRMVEVHNPGTALASWTSDRFGYEAGEKRGRRQAEVLECPRVSLESASPPWPADRGDDLNLISILKELWQRRALVFLAFVLAVAISVLAVFQVSLSPPFVSKRTQSTAEGSIEILVDSARSPIADAQRDLAGLTARAAVFAKYMAGGNVIGRIAKANDLSVKQIDVAGAIAVPSEAPGVEQPLPQLHPYGIAISSADELPILSVVTRAPTVPKARALAAAAPAAIRQVVESIQDQQGTPTRKRVEFRVLGPPRAGLVNDALGKKVALMLFIVFFALGIVLILGVPRFLESWRSTEPEVERWGPAGEPRKDPEVLQLPLAQSEKRG
jgi:hypothetical protein